MKMVNNSILKAESFYHLDQRAKLVISKAVWLWQLLMMHQLFRKTLLFVLAGHLKLCRFDLMLLQLVLFMLHWLLMLRQILM